MIRIVAALILSLACAGGALAQSGTSQNATAIFAAGCFWCTEADFDKVEGVISTTSGYTGGKQPNPTYKEVSAGKTGHTEAVKVVYDPARVSYQQLLDHYWRNVDPFAKDRQFCDVGPQYRSGIFYQTEEEKKLATASKQAVAEKFGKPVETEITKASEFYPAEDYHQDFYKKNELKYKFYRWNCGRDQRLQELWGKTSS